MSKKKIVTACLVVALLATGLIGGSLAYFTDTDDQKNTFEAGNVGINLDEVVVEKNDKTGNYDATDVRTDEDQEYVLYPGMTVAKDPTITVDEGSNDAYVAAKVTVSGDLYDLIGIEGYDTINIHALAKGGLLDNNEGTYGDYNGLFVFQNDEYAIHQVANKAENTWTLYVFMKEAKKAGEEVVLFEELVIPAEYDNAEMAKINGMEINVEAYATQTNGMADCYDAMVKAFGWF